MPFLADRSARLEVAAGRLVARKRSQARERFERRMEPDAAERHGAAGCAVVRIARTPAQFRQFRDLLAEYERDLPPVLRVRDLAAELREIELRYGAPNAAILAVVDGVTAGCVAVTALDDATAVIKRLYVKPVYRKLGLARLLVSSVLDFARAANRRRVVLDTDRDRLRPAYELYRSLGFSDCPPYGPVDYASPTFMELML